MDGFARSKSVKHSAMQRFFILVTAWFGFVLNSHADRVDDYVRTEIKQRKHVLPGVAVAIMKNGKCIKTASYGMANLELKVPVKAETVFEIGSITKQFTTAGILLLQEEGKLSVDDKISRHLKNIPESWKNITIRHLLTHTSGIKTYTGLDGFWITKRLTQEQFLKKIGGFPLDFSPGEKWVYCNTGFSLLGYIIENISGTNYWEFIGARIFGPLGMSLTTNREPTIIIANRASGYETNKNGLAVNRDTELTEVFSAGAIASTVGDLAKWNASLDSEKILSAASKAQMWTPGKLNNGKTLGYGFGWFVSSLDGHKNIRHSGSTSGFSADLERFPDDDLAVVVLTNSDEEGVATKLAKAIAKFYLPEKKKEK